MTFQSPATHDGCRACPLQVRENACRSPVRPHLPVPARILAHTALPASDLRHRARTHHRSRRLEREIKRWREIHVEPKRPAVVANYSPVLAKEPPVARRKNFSRRRRPADRFAKAIHLPPSRSTHVKRRTFTSPGSRAVISTSAPRRRCFAQTESHPLAGRSQQGTERDVHLRPIETDNQKLSDIRRQICHEK